MIVRIHQPSDTGQIARLYYHTVHRVNSRDYTREQIVAWAPGIQNDEYWLGRFERYTVLVAEQGEQVVGFAELEANGHIDCFYVHHDWQRRGVGRRLMEEIHSRATALGVSRLFADVSITASPFFSSMGFTVVEKCRRVYREMEFEQFRMHKPLTEPGG
jgi:putative acetyltransferase